jgi:periplasmic protein TonB
MKVFNLTMNVALLLLFSVTGMWAQGGGYGRAGGGTAPNGAFPKVIQRVAPEYTPEALDAKLEGSVHLSAMIGTDGVPSDIKVTKSLGKGLDEKAIECFKKWRFSPAIRNGEPTPMSSEVAIIFKLPDSK